MESTSSNTSTNSSLSMNKLDLESVDAKMPPSRKESKWFGHYQNDYQYQHQPQQWHQEHSQHSHYWPPQYQYQVPFNLTKGQFEVWQMEAMATGRIEETTYCSQHILYQDPHQGHCQMFYPESGFTKCVNSLLNWGSALVSNAAT